jgi:transposase-like protein
MARTQYSDELKAQAMAALLTGQSVNAVAEAYNIPRGTVTSWASRANAQRGDLLSERSDGQRERIGELIVDNIETMLETTKAMLHVLQDKDWLEKQSASEVAVLFGVIADKTYRLLEAMPDDSDD